MKKNIVPKLVITLLIFGSVETGMYSTALAANHAATEANNNVWDIVKATIAQKVQAGSPEFKEIRPGKVTPLLDKEHKETVYFVELVKASEAKIGGYMVASKGKVIEFSLGDTHPLQNVENPVYYLGPINYAEDLGNHYLRDLRTGEKFSKDSIVVNKQRRSNESNVMPASSSRRVISGVPDYQQSDNTSMRNDCVPTASANVMMYWDQHGYPNLSGDNNWKTVANRFGVLMDHHETGVYVSDIEDGLEDYIEERGYEDRFTVDRDWLIFDFSTIENQIKAGNPTLLSIDDYRGSDGGHAVTAVGTDIGITHKFVAVHDNWASTPKEVWFEYDAEDIDDIFKVERE
ncbi:C39 family peptidase [Baia soyae]|uniref:Peptidase C39-like protein n=1 Tax=Baia soyae TaxID=1544746 RepID=A0A4R2RZK0_9BACL|nr:C39 family peptidase [Baia soyae]TCP68317.1 peptidase C39-like protein [Baia soyae]